MRFSRGVKNSTRYKSMMGFTKVFILLIAIVLLGLGIFDSINPEILMFGNASVVMIILGGMMLVIGVMTSFVEMFRFSEINAWIGAFFSVLIFAVFIVMVSMIYEGGNLFG